jgi:hypothetical protein
MNRYLSVADTLKTLHERGYVADFATDIVCLYCGEFDIRLHPEEFIVDQVFRFEGDTDNNIVLYAITSSTGVKGTLVDKLGNYTANLNFKMAEKLKAYQ